MSSWKDYFDEYRLLYGREYYEWEHFTNVCRVDDTVLATVYGSDDYTVRIELVDDEVSDMSCTCPHANEGNYCKHMACICYYIEENDISKVEKSDEVPDLFCDTLGDEEFKEYLKAKMNTLEKDNIIDLFADVLVSDNELFSDFLYYAFDSLDDNDRLIYRKRLNNILSRKVDIIDSKSFTDALDDYIDTDLFNLSVMKEYSLMFDLIEAILLRLASIMYVRDTFEFEMILDNLKIKMDDLVKEDKKYIERLNNIFTRIADNYSETALIKSFIKLSENYSLEEYNTTRIKLLQMQLEKTDYILIAQIEEIVKLMEESDYTTGMIIEFLEKYPDVYEIGLLLSKYYIKDGRVDDAVQVLRDSCEDEMYSRVSVKALEMLKNIYISRDDDKYIDCIRDLIFRYNHYSNENIVLLREYYKEDWPEEENKIITHYRNMSSNNSNYLKYMIDKKEYDTFRDSIFDKGDYYTLREFEDVLISRYPSELLDAYEKIVYEVVTEAKLKNYKEAAKIIKQMKKVPGGNVKADELVNQLKNMYPRRSRMIKELDNV